MPAPTVVATLLEEASISVVLDLCSYPIDRRESYIADLFHVLRVLRERKFRPQWIVLEEAQQFLPLHGNTIVTALQPMLERGGWAFVSYRPDRIAQPILHALDHCLLARLSNPEAIEAVQPVVNTPSVETLTATPDGHVWLCGEQLVRLRSSGRRIPHVRHLYKYLDVPLPMGKRFHFHTEAEDLG